MPLAQLAGDCVAACSRHIYIGDQHVRPEQPAEPKRLVPPQRDQNLVSFVAQYQREHVRGIAVVIGDQDSQRLRRCGGAARRHYAKGRFGSYGKSLCCCRSGSINASNAFGLQGFSR